MGDEPLLIHLRTGAPVVVGARPHRRGARAAARRIPRSTCDRATTACSTTRWRATSQVIVFDERGAGNGLLLPAGPLREPMPQRAPARSVVLYNAEHASTPWPGLLAARALAGLVDWRAWWRGDAPIARRWAELRGRRVVACAGIGDAAALLRDAAAAGADDRSRSRCPTTTPSSRCPGREHAGDVVVTEKDAVKLRPERVGRRARVGGAVRLRARRARSAPRWRNGCRRPADIAMDHRLLDLLVCPLCKGPLKAERTPGEPLASWSAPPTAWRFRCATASR